jgi:hypothetical protein
MCHLHTLSSSTPPHSRWLGACVAGSSALTQAAIWPATSAALAVLVSKQGVMRARSHAANR